MGRTLLAGLLWLGAAAVAGAKDPAVPPATASQDAPGQEEGEPASQRATVVVTASRHGQKITEAPAAVTVLTSEDIALSGVSTVADLFRRVPGLDFMQTGARDYNVNARGFNNLLSRRLLVLIDGRSVYLTILGFVLWDGIQVTLDDIERIEVVRGPGSALYGANASSGVVNIITKSPAAIDGGSVRVGAGEFGTLEGSVLWGDTAGPWGFKLAASYYLTESFENPDRDADSRFQGEGRTATRQPKIYGRVAREIGEAHVEVDAGWGSTQGTLYTAIGPLDVLPGSDAPFLRASYTRGGLYLQAFWNRMQSETYNLTSRQTNHFTTDSYDLEGQWSAALGERHFLVVGGSAKSSDIRSDLVSQDEVEAYFGLYGQDEMKLSDRWTGTLALRVDHDELVGVLAAPKAGLVFSPRDGHALRLTLATAYNSSSLIESYLDFGVTPFPENPEFVVYARGNPDLEPERITSLEVGYRGFPHGRLLVDASVFHARLEDFIQFVVTDEYAPGIPRTYAFVNGGRASETGVEVSAEWFLTDALSLSASYGYTDVEQDASITDVTAAHKASATVQLAGKRGLAGSLTVAYGGELEFPVGTPFYRPGVVPAYTVVNGSASWRFGRDGRFHAGLNGTNLLDRRHREFIAGDILRRKIVLEAGVRF